MRPFSEVSALEQICGIYAITDMVSCRNYIGSASNIKRRLMKHKAMLRGGYHNNPFLQNSFTKRGERFFCFTVVETCGPDVILKREEYWIDLFKSKHDQNGFNICKPEFGRRGVLFTDEQKKKISDGLRRFIAKNPHIWKAAGDKRRGRRLSPEHIAKTVSGCSKKYAFISPSGEVFRGSNVAQFCRENGLRKSAMCQLRKGVHGHHTHKGWKSINT